MKQRFLINHFFLIILLMNLFHLSFAQNNTETDSLKRLLKTVDAESKIEILTKLCWDLRNSEIQNAILYGSEAIELSEKYNDHQNLTKAYSFLGVAYRNIGNYSKAFDTYYKGLESSKKYGLKDQEGYAYINLSNLYLYQGYYSDALSNLKLAKEIADETDNLNILAYYYINIGRVELKLKNYSAALENLNKAAEIRRKSEKPEEIATCLKYIGDVYKEQNEFAPALKYYKESIEKLENTADLDLITNNYNEISGIYFQEKNYDQAMVYANKSFDVATQIGSKLRLRNACQSLMEIHKTQNKLKEALYYQDLVLSLNDSLFSQEIDEKISHIKFISETFEYEQKLSELKFSHRLELHKQKQIRNVSFIIGFTFIIVSFLLFMFFRVKRKANVDLKEKNKLIQIQKTELEKSIEEIRVANDKLQELNDTKDKFFTIVAHDLKNPFNIILNFSDMLISNFDKYTQERKKEIIGYINKSAENTYKLLENLLLWSRAQVGAIEFIPAKHNLYEISLDTIELINHNAELKSIKLHNNIPKKLFVKVDRILYITIIRNLLTNAVKFTPKGKNIFIHAEKDKGKALISVTDEGIGISKEKLSKIFSVSESISTKGTDNEDGSGIGLILCKEFIEMHDGDIFIESEVNSGTTITFSLPCE